MFVRHVTVCVWIVLVEAALLIYLLLCCLLFVVYCLLHSQEGSGTSAATSSESMWLKIVSQWIFLILYLRVLQVAYNNNTP